MKHNNILFICMFILYCNTYTNSLCFTYGQYIKDIYDCSTYYKCDYSVHNRYKLSPIKMKCTNNTQFSLISNTCVNKLQYYKENNSNCTIQQRERNSICYIDQEQYPYKRLDYECGHFLNCQHNAYELFSCLDQTNKLQPWVPCNSTYLFDCCIQETTCIKEQITYTVNIMKIELKTLQQNIITSINKVHKKLSHY